MCKFCKELKKPTFKSQSKAVLNEGKFMEGELKMKIEIVVDRHDKGMSAYIRTETDIPGKAWCNLAKEISYCPFCGERLDDGMEEGDENE